MTRIPAMVPSLVRSLVISLVFMASPVAGAAFSRAPEEVRGGPLAVGAVALADTPAETSLWQPKPIPAQCSATTVRMLITDISGSMRNMLEGALREQAEFVMNAPPCTYIVYAEFGTTAKVMVDGYLTSEEERTRISSTIRSRRPLHNWTNFIEAAKIIELVLLKLERAYAGADWSFHTSVISDYEQSPGEGHDAFDLQAYLASRRFEARVDVLHVTLVPAGSAQTLEQVIRADGHVTVAVAGLAEVLGAALAAPVRDSISQEGEGTSDTLLGGIGAELEGGPAQGYGLDRRSLVLGVIALGLVLLLISLVWARRSGPRAPEPAPSSDRSPPLRVPRALLLAEEVSDPNGVVQEEIRRDVRIPVAPEVPLVFSTGLEADVRVRPVPGVRPGPILQLTLLSDGRLKVSGEAAVLCNGDPVTRRGTIADLYTPVRIQLGDRVWTVSGVHGDAPDIQSLLTTSTRGA